MRPYSMPLWTIFVKWPAPDGADVRVAVLGRERSRRSARRARSRRRRRRPSGSSRPRGPRSRPRPRSRRSGCPSPAVPHAGAGSRGSWSCRRPRSCRPASSRPSSCWNESSVIFPAGIISHTARGRSSWPTSSSREAAVRDSTFGSKLLTSCPSWRRRSVIPLPIRPSPIIPSCIWPPFADAGDSSRSASVRSFRGIVDSAAGGARAPRARARAPRAPHPCRRAPARGTR